MKARRRLSAGFTLIELLVVMIILAILAAVVIPRVIGRTEDARRAKARSDIAALETALDAYKLDNGSYPTTEQGLQALVEPPNTDPVPKNWSGPYLKKGVPKDPWGNDYVYVCPGEHNPDFDIASYGKDGQPGGEGEDADIVSWEEREES
ncbi:MAG: type II secretion system major pseudopilin GspG [Armatimonadota bacterium]